MPRWLLFFRFVESLWWVGIKKPLKSSGVSILKNVLSVSFYCPRGEVYAEIARYTRGRDANTPQRGYNLSSFQKNKKSIRELNNNYNHK